MNKQNKKSLRGECKIFKKVCTKTEIISDIEQNQILEKINSDCYDTFLDLVYFADLEKEFFYEGDRKEYEDKYLKDKTLFIEEIVSSLHGILQHLELKASEEEDSLDNLPENLREFSNMAWDKEEDLSELECINESLQKLIEDLDSMVKKGYFGEHFEITTLCGSTRFKEEFLDIQKKLTLEGKIVISVGLFGHSGDNEVWTEGTKEMLDRMHKKKIDMADGIFVINKDGYIGESTKSEIEYAITHKKKVEYLEPINSGIKQ